MGTTVAEFHTQALADAGVIQQNNSASGPMLQVAMRKQREMVSNWSTNRLRMAFIPEVEYALQGGKGVYHIGPGAAEFDTDPAVYVKPVFIQAACVIVGTARRWPLNLLTRPQWDINQLRSLQDPDGPLDFFYDFNTPVATFNIAPIPTGAQSMFVSQWSRLRGFQTGEEQLIVEDFYPEEYLRPMKAGLVLELASAWKVPLPDGGAIYADSIAALEKMNNEKLSGAFGTSRTLDGPTKGDGRPVGQQ